MPDFLHKKKDFKDLLRVVSGERGVDPFLVEKDYWIMHCLFGLKQQEQFQFELKGGTSLSKGFGIISRFSEDIDIRFEPPTHMAVSQGKNQVKESHIKSRQEFFHWVATEINIPDIEVEQDHNYDDEYSRNAGIRLKYQSLTNEIEGVKPFVLLEVGFDDTTPNTNTIISSWAYDKAFSTGAAIIDNRALKIPCYNPEYTFVEKLQTISTKYRQYRDQSKVPSNFLRHYADVYYLLDNKSVQKFLGTKVYEERKKKRFRTGDELCIAKNSAFLFEKPEEFKDLEKEYEGTAVLYYAEQPSFSEIIERIKTNIEKM